MSKRSVVSTFLSKRFALFIPLAFVDPQQPVDLKFFLFKLGMTYFSSNISFSEHQMDEALAWLLANQHNVTVVLDGLDQARFEISSIKVPTNVDVYKKYLPSELIVLLLSRNILRGVRLILTSRPHSILKFDQTIQPDFVLFLDDLTERDMKTLMRFYIENAEVDQIVEKLLEKTPRVQQLIYCPLFLRIFSSLVNIVGLNEMFTIVKSTANLFDEFLTRLQDCAHNAGEIEDTNILNKISELAFNKTMEEGSVVIDQSDLSCLSIEPNEIQDLVIAVNGENNSALVGSSMFYFCHQSIQVS